MPGGFLLVLSLVAPVAGVLLAFAVGGRRVEGIASSVMPIGLVIAAGIAVAKSQTDGPRVYLLGGWVPPLGVALRADGPSAVMILIVAVVIGAIGVFARADFRTPAGSAEARAPFAVWILLLAIWGALNMVFVGGDSFTLYVALEAPAAASAVLSGLVVKGSFFLVVRLWFDVMPGLTGYASAQVLGAMGAAAILFGSVVALRQDRLKLLVASRRLRRSATSS